MAVWSGLGMNFGYYTDMDALDQHLVEVKLCGITDIRVSLRDYTNTTQVNNSKLAVARVLAAGLRPIWGVSSNPTTITSTTWTAFHTAILEAAQWAQDNGVFEFQLANEEELHVDGTTMTVVQIRTNIKSTATEVQSIFTNGNISYAGDGGSMAGWASIGKGDLDLISGNVYCSSTSYPASLSALMAGYSPSTCYISEFNLHSSNINSYSTDEEKQATRLANLVNEIKTAGYTKAFFYVYMDPNMGAKKAQNGEYRLLWNPLKSNNGRWSFLNIASVNHRVSDLRLAIDIPRSLV